VGRADHSDSAQAAWRVRGVIGRLLREGAAVARLDGTLQDLFAVGLSATGPRRGARTTAGKNRPVSTFTAVSLLITEFTKASPSTRLLLDQNPSVRRRSTTASMSGTRWSGSASRRVSSENAPQLTATLRRPAAFAACTSKGESPT
jgi:hypothetical protein